MSTTTDTRRFHGDARKLKRMIAADVRRDVQKSVQFSARIKELMGETVSYASNAGLLKDALVQIVPDLYTDYLMGRIDAGEVQSRRTDGITQFIYNLLLAQKMQQKREQQDGAESCVLTDEEGEQLTRAAREYSERIMEEFSLPNDEFDSFIPRYYQTAFDFAEEQGLDHPESIFMGDELYDAFLRRVYTKEDFLAQTAGKVSYLRLVIPLVRSIVAGSIPLNIPDRETTSEVICGRIGEYIRHNPDAEGWDLAAEIIKGLGLMQCSSPEERDEILSVMDIVRSPEESFSARAMEYCTTVDAQDQGQGLNEIQQLRDQISALACVLSSNLTSMRASAAAMRYVYEEEANRIWGSER